MEKREINVHYSGKYPCMCNGELDIVIDRKLVYQAFKGSFESTGDVVYLKQEDGYKTISGKLEFTSEEYERFKEWANTQPDTLDIVEAVREVLDSFNVCCGGCS